MIKTTLFVFTLLVGFTARAQVWNFETDRTISNVKATIKFLEDKTTVVIVPDDNPYGRYISPNLPEEYKKDGLKVTISGEVGKIPPNVRMLGTPLKLKAICVSKSEQQKFKLEKRKYVFK